MGIDVEVWFDIACPYCYSAKRHFEIALEKFEHKKEVNVVYRAYQIDPDVEKTVNHNMHAHVSAKYSIPYEKAKKSMDKLAKNAVKVGLRYNFERMKVTNSFDALRLCYFAKEHGKMKEMIDRLMKAYFTDCMNISDYETLAEFAAEIGLDYKEAFFSLSNGSYSENVFKDKEDGNRIGIEIVPFFVYNNKHSITGDKQSIVHLKMLQDVWKANLGSKL